LGLNKLNKDKLIPEVKNGFSFSCQQCGRCCLDFDGYVFLYEREILRIAHKLNLTLQDCIAKYTDIINSEYIILDRSLKHTKKKVFLNSLVLKQDEKSGACIFLDMETNKCKIYEVRPYQCRSWPKWWPIMTKEKEFREAKEKCPGFYSNDRFISRSDILSSLKVELGTEYRFVKKMRSNHNDIRKCYQFLKKIKFNRDI
jgi:Fe-S-cluster containining protein